MLGYKTQKTTLYIPQSHYKKLQQLAKRNKRRMSDEMRELIEEKLIKLFPDLEAYGKNRPK